MSVIRNIQGVLQPSTTLWSVQFPHRGTQDLEHVATSSQEQ